MFHRLLLLAAAWSLVGLVSVPASPTAGEKADVWKAFHPLLGTWKGEGSGFGSVSDVTHEWTFAIGEKFLRLRTRSVQRTDDGSGEIHEDVGYLSHNTDTNGYVFRQFLSEGFVNTYDVHPGPDRTLRFDYREAESAGGMRARMRIRLTGDDAYTAVLDLASPGKEFASCQEMHMKRIQPDD